MIYFKPDELIWERPKCQNQDCDGQGLVLVTGKLICGGCLVKAKEKEDAYLNNLLQRK